MFVVVSVLACLADQITKLIVEGHLDRFDVVSVLPFLDFRFIENRGIAFSLFSGYGGWVIGATVIVAIVLFAFLSRITRDSRTTQAAVGLVAGGALGNLIDRIRLGYVVDFVHLPHWPTFNVADTCITVGVILVVVTQLFSGEQATPDDTTSKTDEG